MPHQNGSTRGACPATDRPAGPLPAPAYSGVMDERKPPEQPDRRRARDVRTGQDAAANRIRHQSQWVEQQLRESIRRGEFDDLPGFGKPIEGLGGDHDPDWWLKKLVEREQISVLPPALAIRQEDARLADTLDRLATEREVRREVDEFNERVGAARIQPLGGPPMITQERDADAEVAAWHERRTARRAAAAEAARAARAAEDPPRRWTDRLRRRR